MSRLGPSGLRLLADEISPSGEVVKQIVAVLIGHNKLLVGVAMTIAILVEVNCPIRQSGLVRVPLAVSIQVVELGPADFTQLKRQLTEIGVVEIVCLVSFIH